MPGCIATTATTVGCSGRLSRAAAPAVRSRSATCVSTVRVATAWVASTSSKAARGISRTVESRLARTPADLGSPVSSASSPITSPGPSSRTIRPATSISRRPRRTTYAGPGGSPASINQVPAGTATSREAASSRCRASSGMPASIGTADRSVATRGRGGGGQVGADRHRRMHGRRTAVVLAVVLVGGGRDATERERHGGHGEEGDDGQHPAVVEGVDRGRRRGVVEDDDQDRDAQDPAELAGAGDERGRGGVARARDRGQCGTAEEGEGRADTDPADDLARHPLGPERRLDADPLVVPDVRAGPDDRARHDEGAVAVAVRQRAEPGGDHGGDDGPGHQCQSGLQHAVAPDVLQPQDVGQQVGVEAEPGQHRGQAGDPEGREPQQCRVQERRAVCARADPEQGEQHGGGEERPEGLRAAPSPVVAPARCRG